MTTWLAYGDALHVPEIRHEVAEPVGDPIVFLDAGGSRIVVVGAFEVSIFGAREDVVDEVWSFEDLGRDELVSDESYSTHALDAELVRRALARAEVTSATVPASFPLLTADYLRQSGIQLQVDAEAWALRRRRKSPWELEGIERAQRAAETAFVTAARMLRAAEPTRDGRLRFEGEILTAELVREAMSDGVLGQGAEAEQILVQAGDQCLSGHDPGHGPILEDQSVVIDCWPRDRRTGA